MLPAPSTAASCTDADLLLRNGHIVTMDSPPVVTAMAVRSGKILALGSDAELASCVSSRTNIIDLGRRTVLPGLVDVHTHMMEWTKGILRGQFDAGSNVNVTPMWHMGGRGAEGIARPGRC